MRVLGLAAADSHRRQAAERAVARIYRPAKVYHVVPDDHVAIINAAAVPGCSTVLVPHFDRVFAELGGRAVVPMDKFNDIESMFVSLAS